MNEYHYISIGFGLLTIVMFFVAMLLPIPLWIGYVFGIMPQFLFLGFGEAKAREINRQRPAGTGGYVFSDSTKIPERYRR